MEIDAKVAKVLSDQRIAVNAGTARGVSVGDTVIFYEDVEILDPDTNESLGVVRMRRLVLLVEQVQEWLSVAVVRSKRVAITDMLSGRATEPEIRLSEVPQLDTDRYFYVKNGRDVRISIREQDEQQQLSPGESGA